MRPVLMFQSAFDADTPLEKRCVDFTWDTRCGEKSSCVNLIEMLPKGLATFGESAMLRRPARRANSKLMDTAPREKLM